MGTPWYLRQADELATGLVSVVDTLVERDGPRLAAYERYGQLYGGRRRTPAVARAGRLRGTLLTTATAGAPVEDPGPRAALRLNVVKAAVDTIVSKVGSLRPRPTFLTTRGNWTLQRRAKQLQRFVDGAYHQADAYEHGLDYFRDAMVYGTGVLMPLTRAAGTPRARLTVERVPAWEFFVDEDDAEYGSPCCLYRERYVSAARVRMLWGDDALPERAESDAPHTFYTGDNPGVGDSDYVRVIEAWYRPPDPDEVLPNGKVRGRTAATSGRHVILVDVPERGAGGTARANAVVDEYFPYGEFPPVFFHWSKPTPGFWGDSAVREVEGIQVEVNRLLEVMRESMRLVSVPWILEHADAHLTPQPNNTVGQRYVWEGSIPPQVVTHQAVSPQHVQHMWELYAKAFEILGSNQLSASATAPPGLESGRALERLSEEQSERFKHVSRAFNVSLGQHLTRRLLLLAKQLDVASREAGLGGFGLRSPHARYADSIDWRDVSIDPDDYITQVFDTSVLPTLPSARVQEVERMQVAGWIEPDEARRLLDFPDLAESNNYATADYEMLLWQLEQMLEHGVPVLPEPFQSLDRAVRVGQSAILRAQQDRVPETNIDLLRTFVTVAASQLTMAAEPAPGAMPGPAPAAVAGPNSDADRRNDVLTTAAPPDMMPAAGGMM